MKHISTVLSAIALVLIAVLFYLQSGGGSSAKAKKIAEAPAKVSAAESRVAYFDMDTLEAHYEYFKDALSQAKSKESAMNNELANIQKSYQSKITEWQKKGTTMTQAESEQAQQEYALMQQNYQSRKDALQQELYKNTEDLKTSIRKRIEEFLKEYNKQKTYSFIFAYDPSSFIYYKDTVYNITSDMLEGLNASYKKKN
ncbi:MAG TPA: OmpH family outer membrane protein [Puia sp.]|nr:OmpH family outer membrane protein [Puia sp.]